MTDTTNTFHTTEEVQELVRAVLDTEKTAGEALSDSIHNDNEPSLALYDALKVARAAEQALTEATDDEDFELLAELLAQTFLSPITSVELLDAVFSEASCSGHRDFATTMENYRSLARIASLAHRLGLTQGMEVGNMFASAEDRDDED